MWLSNTELFTLLIFISLRLIFLVSFLLFLKIVSSTTLFSGPRTIAATSETFMPLISLPFTAVIISPCLSCAKSAGVAGITLKISIFPAFE